MPRGKKYTIFQDVTLDLASGNTTRKSVLQTKYRAAKAGDEEYVKLIEKGLRVYDRSVKLKAAQDNFILPEDFLTKEELEENVGLRGTD